MTLDALCADLKSCFDPPDTETSAVKANKIVEAQVISSVLCFCCFGSSPALIYLLFDDLVIALVLQVEEIVMNELEILATEVIQEAQVDNCFHTDM